MTPPHSQITKKQKFLLPHGQRLTTARVVDVSFNFEKILDGQKLLPLFRFFWR